MTQSSLSHIVAGAHQMVGHAIVQSLFKPDTVTEVTILPRERTDISAFMAYGRSSGPVQTSDDIRKEGIMSLAGVVAARELTGSVDGCSASFIRANCIATRFVDVTEPRLDARQKQARVAAVVDEWTAESLQLVRANESTIRRVAGVLLEKETLTAAEFGELVG